MKTNINEFITSKFSKLRMKKRRRIQAKTTYAIDYSLAQSASSFYLTKSLKTSSNGSKMWWKIMVVIKYSRQTCMVARAEWRL